MADLMKIMCMSNIFFSIKQCVVYNLNTCLHSCSTVPQFYSCNVHYNDSCVCDECTRKRSLCLNLQCCASEKPGLTGKVLKKADTPTWLEPCRPLYQFHRSLQDELHHQGMLTARKQFLINI